MDIKQDPNSIPNFNGGGRLGELQPNQPEQAQSSVQLDATADGDGGAAGELDAGTTPESPAAEGSQASARAADPSTTGTGAIDGLVGAP